MAVNQSEVYRVVTYVDRTQRGHLGAKSVREVRCHDEAGALFEAVHSLVIASTQPGLYWSEWRQGDPAGSRDGLPDRDLPDRAFLRTDGEIVLDLAVMRDRPGTLAGPGPVAGHGLSDGRR